MDLELHLQFLVDGIQAEIQLEMIAEKYENSNKQNMVSSDGRSDCCNATIYKLKKKKLIICKQCGCTCNKKE